MAETRKLAAILVSDESFENSDNLIVTDLPKIAVKISNRAKIPRRFQANDCIDFGMQLLDGINRRHGHRIAHDQVRLLAVTYSFASRQFVRRRTPHALSTGFGRADQGP